MLKMNDDIRAQWVAALRSGEYEQGKSFLRVGDKHCCLGVLCELAVSMGVVERGEEDGQHWYEDACYDSVLPPLVAEWAGMEEEEGKLTKAATSYTDGDLLPDDVLYLTNLNDRAGWSFDRIADLIEKTED